VQKAISIDTVSGVRMSDVGHQQLETFGTTIRLKHGNSQNRATSQLRVALPLTPRNLAYISVVLHTDANVWNCSVRGTAVA
jgi:hypothetical protein